MSSKKGRFRGKARFSQDYKDKQTKEQICLINTENKATNVSNAVAMCQTL